MDVCVNRRFNSRLNRESTESCIECLYHGIERRALQFTAQQREH